MRSCQQIHELRQILNPIRTSKLKIALVATMGNLHQGHLQLIKTAREYADVVVVSLFVNPLQFGPHDDFDCYPRTLQADQKKLVDLDVEVLFLPTEEVMYPQGRPLAVSLQANSLGHRLCGEYRPELFHGAVTIVAKLLNCVQPDIAVFGEKDYQQLLIMQQLVTDLNFPVRIVPVAITREKDGLAMSSRNQYLTPEQRHIAPQLVETLKTLATKIQHGDKDYQKLSQEGLQNLSQVGFMPQYLEVLHADTLQPATPHDNNLRILIAARLGDTQLIDNISCRLD